jgi:hypothetical protein
MAKPPEKVFWSEEEKLALVMRAIELRMHKMWDSPLDVLRASMAALPADRRRNVRSLAEAPWFVELHDKMLSERLIRHKAIGGRDLGRHGGRLAAPTRGIGGEAHVSSRGRARAEKSDGDPSRDSGVASVSHTLSL